MLPGREVTMSDALRIAASGMYAAGVRLDATAGRIAASGLAPVAPEVGSGAREIGGAPLPPAVDVDLSQNALDLIQARASFSMNAAVARTADAMTRQVLDIQV
jgi:flagellar hook protein FlgE